MVILHTTQSQVRNWKITLPRFDKLEKFRSFCEGGNTSRHAEDSALHATRITVTLLLPRETGKEVMSEITKDPVRSCDDNIRNVIRHSTRLSRKYQKWQKTQHTTVVKISEMT